MLIHNASQLLTLAGGPQRGRELGRLGMIPDGAVLIQDEKIIAVGTTRELRAAYPNEPDLDAGGQVVMPGFVDPHTHAIWAGDRSAEFELRLQGKSYLEILAEGGGILSTVRASRTGSLEKLMSETRPRLWSMFTCGTTTAEVKTGYGLRTAAELRMLQALVGAGQGRTAGDHPHLLGRACHRAGVPRAPGGLHRPDLQHDAADPEGMVASPGALSRDALCGCVLRDGRFHPGAVAAILTRAKELGFPLKIHADEFDNLGGAKLAAELGAVSADHLVKTSPEDIQALASSNTVAVALPCTPFGLAEREYTPAQAILDAGGLLAIATDLNPGTAWCENMQFALALACRYMRLTPAQAIAAATINAAAAIGRADRLGSLEPGKQADLLILSVPDYRHLGYRFGINLVQTVIKKGRIYPV